MSSVGNVEKKHPLDQQVAVNQLPQLMISP